MKDIINSLKEEIKKVSSEENINTVKLNDLTRIYERLKAYNVISVNDANIGVNIRDTVNENLPHMPMLIEQAVPRNETNVMWDTLKEYLHEYFKMVKDNKLVNNKFPRVDEDIYYIETYIKWIKFLKEQCNIRQFLDDEIVEKNDILIVDLSSVLIDLMRNKLDENLKNLNDNKNKEKEKENSNKNEIENMNMEELK